MLGIGPCLRESVSDAGSLGGLSDHWFHLGGSGAQLCHQVIAVLPVAFSRQVSGTLASLPP